MLKLNLHIPTKDEKDTSVLIDGIRILAWMQYKVDHEIKGREAGFKAYDDFKSEWEKDAGQLEAASKDEIVGFLDSMGYTVDGLLKLRSEYYEAKSLMNSNGNGAKPATEALNDEEIPY